VAEGDKPGMPDKHVEAHTGDREYDHVDRRAQGEAGKVERERQERKRERRNERSVFIAHCLLLELLDALAEKAARAHEQHQRHQQIHRRFAPGWVEVNGNAAHDPDQHGGGDHAPE